MSIERARRLRKNLTPQEAKLWIRLREFRALGFHPRRQVPIGPYVVDFAFMRQRIIVEVDGGQHGGTKDAARDAALSAQAYRVMRVWNSDVDENLDGVMEAILGALESAGAP